MTVKSEPNSWSRTKVYKPMLTTSATVRIVAEIHSSRVGQVTRRSSAITLRIKSPPARDWAAFFCCSFTKGSLPKTCTLSLSKGWQGGQDSNLQQLVLETRTLPIELPPYRVSLCGLWQRQKRQYLLSSSRSVVFCLFFCVL